MDAIHLQGIGKFRAKKAKEFKVGEKIVYNYGETSILKEIKPIGKSSLLWTTESKGKLYTRKVRKETLRGWHL